MFAELLSLFLNLTRIISWQKTFFQQMRRLLQLLRIMYIDDETEDLERTQLRSHLLELVHYKKK
jgi:hypothetical protein